MDMEMHLSDIRNNEVCVFVGLITFMSSTVMRYTVLPATLSLFSLSTSLSLISHPKNLWGALFIFNTEEYIHIKILHIMYNKDFWLIWRLRFWNGISEYFRLTPTFFLFSCSGAWRVLLRERRPGPAGGHGTPEEAVGAERRELRDQELGAVCPH